MKLDNYSRGPWVECHDQVLDGDGFAILRATENPLDKTQHRANVQRIVACVNACEGIPTEVMENTVQRGGAMMYQQDRRKTAEAQRDELLEQLVNVVAWLEQGDVDSTFIDPMRAAIAKAKGAV